MDAGTRTEIEAFAKEIRKRTILEIGNLGVGHIGGALSIVDALAVLYGKQMKYDAGNPRMPDRDRLVVSKGHAGPALYAALAIKGFFPLSWLDTLNQGGTRLPSHCDRTKTPGIDMTTGSLGQGFSAACGIALAVRMDKRQSRVYCIIGDGESDEGQIWEAAMFAAHAGLSNLIAFTDVNKCQIDGATNEVLDLEDFVGKWEAFGWYVERVNGHDVEAIDDAIGRSKGQGTKPSMIVMDTIKAKGCSFCEGQVASHNMSFSMDQAREAVEKLG